jgi:hypothetical protein
MLDTPTKAGAADFKQRYCNGYGIFITKEGRRIVVYLDALERGRLHFRDANNQEYFVNVDTHAQFEFLPSVRGWHQQEQGAVLLARIPARQYNRGINHHNTSAMVYSGTTFLSIEVDHNLVESLFNETPPPLLERVTCLFSGVKDFCVLSPYFCLTHGKVFLSNLHIGDYTKATHHINIVLSNPVASQELTDLINRNNLPMRVSQ